MASLQAPSALSQRRPSLSTSGGRNKASAPSSSMSATAAFLDNIDGSDSQLDKENQGEAVGIANLPNQLHRLLTRKGAHFTLMVVGESGLGKTTFVNTLFAAKVLDDKKPRRKESNASNSDKGKSTSTTTTTNAIHPPRTVHIEITKALIEERGFNCRLTVIDTPGFGDHINNSHCWQPILQFLDDQHEAYFRGENQPVRDLDALDTRVHACLYFVPPTGHALRAMDVQVMRELCKRVNVIPVIAKADTVSPVVLPGFKERIRNMIAEHSITPYTCPIQSDDEETTQRNIDIMSSMPFAVIGSTVEVPSSQDPSRRVLGRQYSWGTAEVENENHCDFKKLRSLLIRTHMHDLLDTTQQIHYENYRMHRLENRGGYVDSQVANQARQGFEAKIKEEEQRFRARLAERVHVEESRFQQWEERLVQERARLTKNLEAEHAALKHLIAEVEAIEKARK